LFYVVILNGVKDPCISLLLFLCFEKAEQTHTPSTRSTTHHPKGAIWPPNQKKSTSARSNAAASRPGGGYEPFWKLKSVAEALSDDDTEFRCSDCHRRGQLHRHHLPDAPPPHIAHKLKTDSEYCPAGIFFRKATDGRLPASPSTPSANGTRSAAARNSPGVIRCKNADKTAAAADLQQLASDVLARALRAGATDAEAVVYEGDEFSTLVRLGQVETLKESGSRAVGLRVFIASGKAQRTASTSSSDFSREASTAWSKAQSPSPASPPKIPSPPSRSL